MADPRTSEQRRGCGPCNGNCYQGRRCPARVPASNVHSAEFGARLLTWVRRAVAPVQRRA